MVKIRKDNIVKEIQENILPEYLRLGWEVIKDEIKEIKPKDSSTNNLKPINKL